MCSRHGHINYVYIEIIQRENILRGLQNFNGAETNVKYTLKRYWYMYAANNG